eukprot:6027982-Amphidinium_carterae.1
MPCLRSSPRDSLGMSVAAFGMSTPRKVREPSPSIQVAPWSWESGINQKQNVLASLATATGALCPLLVLEFVVKFSTGDIK